MKRNKNKNGEIIQGITEVESIGTAFREVMRESVRGAMWEIMKEEVERLCGSSHYPEENAIYRRAGSEDGVMYFQGRKEAIKRPRVRARQPDGREREIGLKSYQQARQKKNIEAEMMAFIEEGLSTRSAERVSGGAMSSSEISRMFIAHSVRRLEEFRSRDLSEDAYFGLMIDGVHLLPPAFWS